MANSNQPRSAAPRIEILELLRGIAALAVAWYHFTQGGFLPEGWLKSTGHFGWLGVEVFFVVSGFIIPYSLRLGGYQFPSDAPRFLAKRIVRLDPPYIAAIVLALLLWYVSAALPGFKGQPPQVEPVGLLLHLGYLTELFGRPWVIPAFWSLAIEFQFYLLVALIFPVLIQARLSLALLLLFMLQAIALLLPSGAMVFKYIGLFAMGIASFWLGNGRLSALAHAALLLGLGLLAGNFLGWPHALTGCATAVLIAYAKLPPIAFFSWLGSLSYSLYLMHVPIGGRVINLGSRFANDTFTQILVLIAAMLLSILAAWLLHRWVELPSRRWSSRIRYSSDPDRQSRLVQRSPS